jgi:hypothetical protein
MGGKLGTVWMTTLSTGTAATDVALILNVGTTATPSTGTVQPVLYVGYAQVGGVPYIYAVNSAQLTVFGVKSSGYTALWASTPTQGYVYGTSWTASSTVSTFTAGSVVTDIPLVLGNALLLPVFVPGTGCSNGSAYYDFFDLTSGAFPSVLPVTIAGSPVTADLLLGSGPAYTPSVTVTSGGLVLNSGTKGTTDDSNKRLGLSKSFSAKAYSWRQH